MTVILTVILCILFVMLLTEVITLCITFLIIQFRKKSGRFRLQRTQKNVGIGEETVSRDDVSVLYLRPFHADNQYISSIVYRGKKYETVEALISEELNKIGVSIAIGRPNEKFQPRGVNRYYVHKEEAWQDVVVDFLKNAKLVILYVDFTPGVVWEISQAVGQYRDKLIIIPKVYGTEFEMYFRPNRFLTFLNRFALLIHSILNTLYCKPTLFRYARRGKKYYQEWNRVFSDSIGNNLNFDDSVCAVTFRDGKAKLVTSKSLSLEERLYQIIKVIQCTVDNKEYDNVYAENKILETYKEYISVPGGIWPYRDINKKRAVTSKLEQIGRKLLSMPRIHLYQDGISVHYWWCPIDVTWINGIKFRKGKKRLLYTDIESINLLSSTEILISYKYFGNDIVIHSGETAQAIIYERLLQGKNGKTLQTLSSMEENDIQNLCQTYRKKSILPFVLTGLAAVVCFWEFWMFLGFFLSIIQLFYAEYGGKIRKLLSIILVVILFILLCRFS